ncbi:hypothetical protein FD754_018061, partial [Muntiacus muntjak]
DSVVKNLPAMQERQERWVQSPGPKDLLQEEIATHSTSQLESMNSSALSLLYGPTLICHNWLGPNSGQTTRQIFPGEGNGNPLKYSCLENPMDRGAWQAIVHGVSRIGHDLATKPLPTVC